MVEARAVLADSSRNIYRYVKPDFAVESFTDKKIKLLQLTIYIYPVACVGVYLHLSTL